MKLTLSGIWASHLLKGRGPLIALAVKHLTSDWQLTACLGIVNPAQWLFEVVVWDADSPDHIMRWHAVISTAGAHARRVTITAIVVDSILAGGAVARGWSGYLAVLARRIRVLCCAASLTVWAGLGVRVRIRGALQINCEGGMCAVPGPACVHEVVLLMPMLGSLQGVWVVLGWGRRREGGTGAQEGEPSPHSSPPFPRSPPPELVSKAD